ncbi:G2/mitotic-specific cyclin-2 [Castilleja foliolosa]|uniref:G2/mitotic-specific cyclin-2 n=1 Tax=Castilleja foliolosa TaxID=1961234 RepID=A0ABD3DBH1_9LAMI
MASRRPAVQQQNIGEGRVQGIIKQKNMAAVAGKTNRRALGDIQNLVTVRGVVDSKPIPQATRPVTRGYSQLLANSKAENKKNPLAANGNEANMCRPEKKPVARNPIQRKAVSIKSKPTEIKSDPKEVEEKNRKEVEKSSKTKNPTLTSTLTARSKAACGLNIKPKTAQIIDIDADDANNDLAVVEYIEEMYTFYKSVENEGRAYNNYIDSQPEINEKMRAILIDWLVQVHQKFELSQETLYLTINIVDRYLASKMTLRKELQLVGMSAMLIASKYEEIWGPQVNELVCISDRTYSNEQVLMMEKRILGALDVSIMS